MKKKNIYIYYEFYKREFLSNLLLSIFAAKKNFDIYIGKNKVFNKIIEKNLISEGIFHTKSLTHGKEKSNFHNELVKKNFIITSIDQEHGVINEGNFDDIFIKPRIDISDLNNCSAFFCWGKYDFKKFNKKFKKFKRFYLTGSPRVDLWKSQFQELWNNDELKKKKYFLFVSNFNYICNHYSFKKLIKRKEQEGYYVRSPNLKKIDYQYFEYQKKTFKKFIELILEFAKRFPEKEIFVRPHPTEDPIYWKNLLQSHNNIHIKPEGDLTEYIKNSECVIQNGCTSAIETFILKKPLINYIPVNSKKNVIGKFVEKFSINLKKKSELFEVIENKNFKFKKRENIVNQRMLFKNKELSSKKITDVWSKIYKRKRKSFNNVKHNNDTKIFFYLLFSDYFNKILTNFVLFFKNKLYLKKVFFHKSENLEKEKIDILIGKLCKCLKIKNTFKVKKLGDDLIKITLEK